MCSNHCHEIPITKRHYFKFFANSWFVQEKTMPVDRVGHNNPHCVKSVRIWSCYGPHFPAFGLNTERYSVSLRIQSECGKMRTRLTPNTEFFYAVPENRISNLRIYKQKHKCYKIKMMTGLFSCVKLFLKILNSGALSSVQ